MSEFKKKTSLSIMLALLAGLGMIFLLAYQASINFTAALEKARSDNHHLAQVAVGKVLTLSREVTLSMGLLADQMAEHNETLDQLKTRLQQAQNRLPQVDNFALVQNSGKLAIELDQQAGKSLEQDFFPLLKQIENHDRFISISTEAPRTLLIGQKLAPEQDLLLARFSRSFLQTVLENCPRQPGQSLYLLDQQLNLVATIPEQAPALHLTGTTLEQLKALRNSNATPQGVSQENSSRLLHFQRIDGSPLIVASQYPAEYYLDNWKLSVLYYLVAGTTVLLLTLLMAFYFWRSQRLRHSLKNKQLKLAASETRFRQMIETTPVGLILVRMPDFFITYINQPAAQLFGWPQAAALSKRAHELYYDRIDFIHHTEDALAGRAVDNVECILKHREGNPFWANVSMSATHAGEITTLVIGVNDITPRKRLEEELKRQATTDSLSGLANRAHFMKQAKQELIRANRYHHSACVMMLDIDFFKKVNDQYGHQVGDTVIKTMANLCRGALRDNDLLARIGGEEFTALLPETTLQKAFEVAERLRKAIEMHRVELDDGREIQFTTSIGISLVLESDHSIEDPLKRADEALYASKHQGRNCTTTYESL